MKLKIFLLMCLLSFCLNAYSQKSKTEPIKVGETAPDFVLKDQDGKEVKLSKIKKNVMLVFYRGFW
jgi:cytochrome oxidase Cu insertion factor (SCO1/SenC/PrrC family)